MLEAAQRAAEAAASSGLPTEVVTKRSEYVYQHKPGLVPGGHIAGWAVQGRRSEAPELGWVGAARAGLADSAAALRATRAASLVVEQARPGTPANGNEHPTWPPLSAAPRFNDKRYMQLGTPVSMGRARWTTDGASIFSGELNKAG